ncbi:cytochrome c oxidase assembly protein [Brachybacterium sp. GCM10030252]
MDHEHDLGPVPAPDVAGWALFESAVGAVLLVAAAGYALALWAARDRSPWPARRSAAWFAGLGCAAAGLVGPLAAAAHTSFTAHMAGHLLAGMLGPLLLVLGSPVSLALRALPVTGARRLSRLLRTAVIRALTHPAVAGVLNLGGLWLLYATGLYPLMHSSALVHALVHAHIVLAGYLFTASLVGADPTPHRASIRVRSAVLVAFIAGHSILAKWLWASPPAGVAPDDGRAGAQLMYYGGDAIDVALIVLLLHQWYVATRPRVSLGPASTGENYSARPRRRRTMRISPASPWQDDH